MTLSQISWGRSFSPAAVPQLALPLPPEVPQPLCSATFCITSSIDCSLTDVEVFSRERFHVRFLMSLKSFKPLRNAVATYPSASAPALSRKRCPARRIATSMPSSNWPLMLEILRRNSFVWNLSKSRHMSESNEQACRQRDTWPRRSDGDRAALDTRRVQRARRRREKRDGAAFACGRA